jgi:uncharacterized protein YjcR
VITISRRWQRVNCQVLDHIIGVSKMVGGLPIMTQQQKHESALCGVATKRGKLCMAQAGKGTDHLGKGACKHHGGASKGAAAGNKNAVKTHEFEAIWLDQLDPEEVDLANKVATDKVTQLDNEITLTEIRIRRMLKSIAALKAGAELIVSEDSEGVNQFGRFSETKREHRDKRIQALEDALTRVQTYKAKLIQTKHEFEKATKDAPQDGAGIGALVDALERSRQHWKEQAINGSH